MTEADLDTADEPSSGQKWVSRAVNIFVFSSVSVTIGLELFYRGDTVFPALTTGTVFVLAGSRLGENADFGFAYVGTFYRYMLVVVVLFTVLTAAVFDVSLPFSTVLINMLVGGTATAAVVFLYWSVS